MLSSIIFQSKPAWESSWFCFQPKPACFSYRWSRSQLKFLWMIALYRFEACVSVAWYVTVSGFFFHFHVKLSKYLYGDSRQFSLVFFISKTNWISCTIFFFTLLIIASCTWEKAFYASFSARRWCKFDQKLNLRCNLDITKGQGITRLRYTSRVFFM